MILSGDIQINDLTRTVLVQDIEVHLTATEYRLLFYLAVQPGYVFSQDHLLDQVWGYDSEVQSRTVVTNIKRLRKKLGSSGQRIKNIRSFGYKLQEAA
jgi:two-component system phosphate regulon response regulator PhoB